MSTDAQTFLDRGTRFEGKILVTGTVRLDGYFKGDGEAQGTLIIGEPGVVEADLAVDAIVVHGHVTGTVAATDHVEVGATGRIDGVVTTPRLRVHDGAVLNVEIRMSSKQPPRAMAPAPSSGPAAAGTAARESKDGVDDSGD